MRLRQPPQPTIEDAKANPFTGVGEKIIVYEHPETVDIERIRSFYAAMPQHMQDKILILGVANYCLSSGDDNFIKQMHDFFFPNCTMKRFVRYE